MKTRFWIMLLMTTFASAFYITANPNKLIEDGQVASTSDSQKFFNSKSHDLKSIRHLRRIPRASLIAADDTYAEPIDISLPTNVGLSDDYRQRYKAKTRMRMQPRERVDAATRRRRKILHRQRIQRKLRKLKRELQMEGVHKSSNVEEVNEELCATERRIVQMHDSKYDYYPAFYEEVHCKSVAPEDLSNKFKPVIQKYFDGILRCVQITKDLYFTRIKRNEGKGDVHIIKNVAVGCQAMWPADQWGHQEL